ncbi:hypothetical protein I316_05754 [Kwoniella heveanensis BCC8398]|uniref:Uncharacterized protein n=1 Tax=Kwoniella heveanensis BCC8398 TaxID=1296120 RepID=A0A1B9GN83_9TREE|nr:hypothetical protein I316_05754 [Kwoniella heveanensis BCC8398]
MPPSLSASTRFKDTQPLKTLAKASQSCSAQTQTSTLLGKVTGGEMRSGLQP